MRYLPNALSIARIAMGIIVGLAEVTGYWALALWLFLAAAISDMVDGALARRLDVESDLGHKLDRWGDFTLLASCFIGLVLSGVVPVILFVKFCGALAFGVLLARIQRTTYGQITHRQFVAGAISLVIIIFVLGGLLASKAYGWSWWYLAIGTGAAAFVAIAKRGHLSHS